MGEGIGLSGTGAGNHEQWWASEPARGAVLDGLPLLGVEGFEVGGCRFHLGVPVMAGIVDAR
jgi:hypothetical protein